MFLGSYLGTLFLSLSPVKALAPHKTSGTKAARASRTAGKATHTATRAPRESKAARAFRALALSPHAADLLALAGAREQAEAQRAALAALPLHTCATRAEWCAGVRARAHARRMRDVARLAVRVAMRRALAPRALATSCAMLTTPGALALRERAVRGTNDASATRRTRGAPQVESVRAMLARLLPLASAQRALAPALAEIKAQRAAHAEAEAQCAALAAYGDQPARARRAKISREARAARTAQLTQREARTLAECEQAQRKGALVPLAARDLNRARAIARRTRRANGQLLALLVARGLPLAARVFWLARFRFVRRERARALRRERHAARAALIVARQRARIQTLGSVAVRDAASGERIGRKVLRAYAPASGAESIALATRGEWKECAPDGNNPRFEFHAASGAAFELDAREGTGVPVEWQAVREMELAARAEFLAGGEWKAANSAARREIHRALKEPTFANAEQATLASDRAMQRARDAWKGEECAPNPRQPERAEFLAESDAEAEAPVRAAIQRWRMARRAVRALWNCSRSPYAASGLQRDRISLRALARGEISGARALCFAGRKQRAEVEAAYRTARNLAARVEQGRAIMARAEAIAREGRAPLASEEQPAPQPAPRALWTLARGSAEVSAENWREQFRKGALPLAARLLAEAHARETHGGSRGSDRREGRAATRTRAARAAKGALRAPLAPGALAALAKLG